MLFRSSVSQATNKDIPLYEGKYINQFRIMPDKIAYKIKRDSVEKRVGDLYKEYRIGLRKVARSTDKRSLIATLLPPNVTSTYSLQVQRNVEQTPLKNQLLYLGFINSYTVDFALRQLISINISQISLQQLPIPKIEEIKDAANIIQISKELLKENDGYYQDLDDLVHGDAYQGYSHDELVAELNARVMLDFNLTRQEVVTLMHTFESAAHKKEVQEETQRILDCYDRLSEDR